MQLVDQLVGDLGEPALVGVGQFGGQFSDGHPGHLGDFDVLVGEFATAEAHQIVVHGLVNAPALGDEPVVDAAERRQHAALDAGLLGHLADGGLFGRFTLLDVTFRQRPQHPSAAVDPPDQGGHLMVLGSVDAVDDQPACRCFVHGAQTIRGTARPGFPRFRGLTGLAAGVGGGDLRVVVGGLIGAGFGGRPPDGRGGARDAVVVWPARRPTPKR